MAYFWSFWLLRWWQFWRMPHSEASRRVSTARHRRKVAWVRRMWLLGGAVVWVLASPPLTVGAFLLLTFLSFVLLDETA